MCFLLVCSFQQTVNDKYELISFLLCTYTILKISYDYAWCTRLLAWLQTLFYTGTTRNTGTPIADYILLWTELSKWGGGDLCPCRASAVIADQLKCLNIILKRIYLIRHISNCSVILVYSILLPFVYNADAFNLCDLLFWRVRFQVEVHPDLNWF